MYSGIFLHVLCNMYSTVGRFKDNTYIRPEINILLRLYIEGMDRPTVLYILYTMVSVQQTNI